MDKDERISELEQSLEGCRNIAMGHSENSDKLKKVLDEFPINCFPPKPTTPFEKRVYDWYWWKANEVLKDLP